MGPEEDEVNDYDGWPGREETHFTIPKQRTRHEDTARMQALVASAQPQEIERNPFDSLAVCDQTHGEEDNAASVYGHYGSVRICIRLKGTDIWIYDSAYEA